jgi:DNA polymerase-3 subunit epsilon
MSLLQLERPIIFFDLETTGTNVVRDRIVEISVVKVFPDGRRETNTRLINPEMPIPEGAAAIHGITDADVAEQPVFSVIAANLLRYFDGCDIGGYNIIKFDIPLLTNEFNRVGLEFSMAGRKVVDAYNIFCKLFPRTLGDAYRLFCGKELEDAHSAEADTLATLDVVLGQIAKHPEIGATVGELHKFSENSNPDNIDSQGRFRWSGTDVIVSFGKYSGRLLREVAMNEPGFLRWIIRSDFPDDVKKIATDALAGIFPRKSDG